MATRSSILFVTADAGSAQRAAALLRGAPGAPHAVEWARDCTDAVARLRRPRTSPVTAIVLELALRDSVGLATFERIFAIAPHVPILVRAPAFEEELARDCLRRGAQDYVLEEASLPGAFARMLLRAGCAQSRHGIRHRAELLLDSIGDAVMSTDVAGRITYLNPVAEAMTGWPMSEARGRPLDDVLRIVDARSRLPLHRARTAKRRAALAVGAGGPAGVLIGRDGREAAIEDRAAPIHGADGRVDGAVIIFRDVGVARELMQRMAHLAHHDPLTGLPNRMLLDDRLGEAIALARRHRKSLAVLFIDVDHFKAANDAHGHAIGDRLLRSIAQRLVACGRGSDTVCRMGGDEFVILLPDLERAEDARRCADKVLEAMRAPHCIDAQPLLASVSIGMALFPRDGVDAATLLRRADGALAQAKRLGRGNCHCWVPGPEESAASRPVRDAAASSG